MGKKKKKGQIKGKDADREPLIRAMEPEKRVPRWYSLIRSPPLIGVAILTLIALALRLYHLGYNSFWLDEAATYVFAQKSLLGIWELNLVGGDFNPPLFTWIEHFMLYLGTSEIILRIIPAIVGTITVPVAFLAGKKFCNGKVGLLVAALFTFSSFHLFYSQDARAYTLMTLFVVMGFYFFVDSLNRNTWRSWVLFGIFFSLGFWTHFYAMVAYVVLVLYAGITLLSTVRKDVRNSVPFLTGIGAFALLSLPLIVVTVKLFLVRTASAPTYGIQGWNIVSTTFTQLSGYNSLSTAFLLTSFIMGCVVLGFRQPPKALLLISGLFLPLLISYVLSFRMPMIPRYLIFLLLFYFLGVACLFLLLPRERRTWLMAGIGVLLIAMLNAPMLVDYYSHYTKEDWRGFSTIMATTTRDGDAIVLLPGYLHDIFNFYYDNRTDRTVEYEAYSLDDIERLVQERGNASVFFVVTSDIFAADPKGTVLNWLNANGKPLQQYYGIYLFTLR